MANRLALVGFALLVYAGVGRWAFDWHSEIAFYAGVIISCILTCTALVIRKIEREG